MSGAPKLAFGFSKQKSQTKVAVNLKEDGEQRDLMVGISGSNIETLYKVEATKPATKIIPRQENTLTVGPRKFTPTFVPEAESLMPTDTSERFEIAAAAAPTVQQYGLVQSSRAKRKEEVLSREEQDALQRKRFKEDLDTLPEHCTEEGYEEMPVEDFGKALFRGMGWVDGEGVGKKRLVVPVKQVAVRPERLGLGAKPAMLAAKDKKDQDKAAAASKGNGVADGSQVNGNGTQRNTASQSPAPMSPAPSPVAESSAAVASHQVSVGSVMYIIDGRHKGGLCEVLKMLPREAGRSDRAQVLLQRTQETVEVRCKELAEPASAAAANGSQQVQSSGRRRDAEVEDQAAPSGRRREANGHKRPSSLEREEDDESDEEDAGHGRVSVRRHSQAPTWLFPSIRVRVVDERLKGGRLHSKKGTVLDVHPGALADVSMDDTREVVQVHEKSLETVVPKSEGALVLIVRGSQKGQRAKLLRRNVETQMAAVQLEGDYAIERLPLDDVAEYVGGEDR